MSAAATQGLQTDVGKDHRPPRRQRGGQVPGPPGVEQLGDPGSPQSLALGRCVFTYANPQIRTVKFSHVPPKS